MRGERWPALATLCAVLFLTFLDNTVVSVALADIQTTLHSGVTQLQWIVDGYMLAFAGLMLAGGTLGDLFGRKKVMLGGVVLFCAGSLVAALASGNSVLIGGRVLMGIGAAASEPGTLSMIRHIYPEQGRRARALGAWTAVSGAALALGPIIGGLLVGWVGWRGVFWFNLAAGALVLAVAAAVLPENADPEGRRLDVVGLVLGAVLVTAATFAVIEGESVGYTKWWIDLLFAVAAAAAAAFVIAERRSPDPVVRLEFFRKRGFTVANIAAFATSFGIFAVFFFTALYLQLIGGFSGWKVALQFVSMAAAIVIAAPIASTWTARRGPREPLTTGCLLAGVGLFAVDALLGPHVSIGALAWALAVTGVGFGLTLVAMTESVLTLVPPERSGMAASTLNTSRQLGGVFGVAVLGALVNAQLTANLKDQLAQLGIPSTFQGIVINAVTHGGLPTSPAGVNNPAAAGHQTLVAKVLQAAEDAFGSGLHLSLLIAGAMLLAAAVVSYALSGSPALRVRTSSRFPHRRFLRS
jgi:EmrB/QacA subfamily drug resistance transporter